MAGIKLEQALGLDPGKITRKSLEKIPLPMIPWTVVELAQGVSVELLCDPYSKFGGVISKILKVRMGAPARLREEFFTWILIQLERKRLGLRYLEPWEMQILP